MLKNVVRLIGTVALVMTGCGGGLPGDPKTGSYRATGGPGEFFIEKSAPDRGVCVTVVFSRVGGGALPPDAGAKLSEPAGWAPTFADLRHWAHLPPTDSDPCRQPGTASASSLEGKLDFKGDDPTVLDTVEILVHFGDTSAEYLHAANVPVTR